MEYDDIIIGKRKSFSERFFNNDKSQNQTNALHVIKYAFTRYLGWSPDFISQHMSDKIMEKLHINHLMRFINYPPQYDKAKDYYYLVSLVYKHKEMDMREKTIDTYTKVLSKEKSKFPKAYFSGSDGMVRAGICLQHMISHHLLFSSINELYSVFASDYGYDLLSKYKLLNACKESFETPVDFLHFILPKEQKNSFYYFFYKFMFLTEMNTESGRKKKSEKNYLLKGDLL